jgi:hypothetical protein
LLHKMSPRNYSRRCFRLGRFRGPVATRDFGDAQRNVRRKNARAR